MPLPESGTDDHEEPTWAEREIAGEEGLLLEHEWISTARLPQYPVWYSSASWLVIGGRGRRRSNTWTARAAL